MTDRPAEREFEAASFDAAAMRRATNNYVEPDCFHAGMSGAAPLVVHLEELLRLPNVGQHYLLLADPGMGKTSFLLNYFNRNRKRRAAKRLRIVLVSLRQRDALRQLEAVQAKNEVAAFLDAFDEDCRAIESREQRLREIMAVCGAFKCIVIACTAKFVSNDEALLGQYAFEKIHLSPFSERQINEYLRASIPWYQWRYRQQANSLAASMGDLATQPMWLALVPELVVAERQISELFELYEFMVERWLASESGWIEPGTLRTVAEKLAVAIYVQLSTGGTDRVAVEDAARIANVETATIDAWPLTTQSLLNRDGAGRFRFAHQSTLEYLFISALFHGETKCLSVRWSDFMRRLFVTGTNVMQKRQEDAALHELLDQNFSHTGLFPLSERHRDPANLQTSEILNTLATPRSTSLHAAPTWDPTRYVVERHVDDSLYLCDRSSDTIFFVPTDWRRVESGAVDPASARLFLVTRGEADGQIARLNDNRADDRSNWRLPTLEEMDLVFLLNLRKAFLSPEQYVWTADHTSDGERVVAQMRPTNNDLDARLNPIGVRKVLAANVATTGYFVSSMPRLGVRGRNSNFDTSFPALLIRVSPGAAELFADEQTRVAGQPAAR